MAPRRTLTDEDVSALRYEIGELFTPSSPVRIADLFAGRISQIRQLVDAVAEPGRHAILYGERGVGKTSLVQIVEYLIPTKTKTIRYYRKPCSPGDDFESIWRKFFRDIHIEVRQENGTDILSIDELYSDKIEPYDVVRELGYFSENDIPIFVIDEYNEIADSSISNEIANTIKALSDDTVNATIIVVGVGDNVVELFDEHESIERCCEEVPMPRMSQEELGEVIDKRLSQLGMSIEPDARWKIIILSRGLPMYVHRLGKESAIFSVSNRRLRITEDDVDRALEDMLQGSLQSLRQKYDSAIRSNQPGNLFQEVLLACALTRSDDTGYFTPGSVREPLSKITGRSMQIAQYQNHLNNFISEKRARILQRIGEERSYKFRFRDPAMQPYVLMKGLSTGMLQGDIKTILSFPEQSDLFSTDG